MGKSKKEPGKKKPKGKCMVTKFRVKILSQWRDFNSQEEARKWALEILQAPIYFIYLDRVEVEGGKNHEWTKTRAKNLGRSC